MYTSIYVTEPLVVSINESSENSFIVIKNSDMNVSVHFMGTGKEQAKFIRDFAYKLIEACDNLVKITEVKEENNGN